MAHMWFALAHERGSNFATVLVKDSAVLSEPTRSQLIEYFEYHFGLPVVLCGERNKRLFGRDDIVRYLSKINLKRLPWRKGEFH